METIKNLRQRCKQQGIRGYSRLRKPELLHVVNTDFYVSPIINKMKQQYRFQKDLFTAPRKPREKKLCCEECGGYFGPSEHHFHPESVRVPRTVRDLRALCKRQGIRRYSGLRKAELFTRIVDEIGNKALPAFDPELFGDPTRSRKYRPVVKDSAFQFRLGTYLIENHHNLILPREFLTDVSVPIRSLIAKHLRSLKALKVNFLLLCDFRKGEEEMEKNFKTQNAVIRRTLTYESSTGE